MTATTSEAAAEPVGGAAPRVPAGVRVLRVIGWTLISAGAVVLLYLVYSLLFTNLETSAAQSELLESWERSVGSAEPPEAPVEPVVPQTPQALATEPTPTAAPTEPVVQPASTGGATAALLFERPGSEMRPVREDILFVVEDVTVADLRRGPGHYPRSALPGQEGNFAVAGHRTTYGAPFFAIDELVPGDEIHAAGADGIWHVYTVREQRIVSPLDVWVVEPDPLGTGRPTLTLTTCHPRFSNAQRLIVFAELSA